MPLNSRAGGNNYQLRPECRKDGRPTFCASAFLPLRLLGGWAKQGSKEKLVRSADKVAAWLVFILGFAHLAVGHAVVI